MTAVWLAAAGLLIVADVHPVAALVAPAVPLLLWRWWTLRTTTVHVVGRMRRWG